MWLLLLLAAGEAFLFLTVSGQQLESSQEMCEAGFIYYNRRLYEFCLDFANHEEQTNGNLVSCLSQNFDLNLSIMRSKTSRNLVSCIGQNFTLNLSIMRSRTSSKLVYLEFLQVLITNVRKLRMKNIA